MQRKRQDQVTLVQKFKHSNGGEAPVLADVKCIHNILVDRKISSDDVAGLQSASVHRGVLWWVLEYDVGGSCENFCARGVDWILYWAEITESGIFIWKWVRELLPLVEKKNCKSKYKKKRFRRCLIYPWTLMWRLFRYFGKCKLSI